MSALKHGGQRKAGAFNRGCTPPQCRATCALKLTSDQRTKSFHRRTFHRTVQYTKQGVLPHLLHIRCGKRNVLRRRCRHLVSVDSWQRLVLRSQRRGRRCRRQVVDAVHHRRNVVPVGSNRWRTFVDCETRRRIRIQLPFVPKVGATRENTMSTAFRRCLNKIATSCLHPKIFNTLFLKRQEINMQNTSVLHWQTVYI